MQCWYCKTKVKAKRINNHGELAWYYHCRKCNSIEYKVIRDNSALEGK